MPARSDASVKRLTLIACIMGSGIALLDGTVVNVALPTIQRHLGGGLTAQLTPAAKNAGPNAR